MTNTDKHALATAMGRIQHLKSLLLAIRNVNQLIVHESDPEKLIREASNLLIEIRGYAGTRIVLSPSDDQTASVAVAGNEVDLDSVRSKVDQGWLPPCSSLVQDAHGMAMLVSSDVCMGCPLTVHGTNETAAVSLRYGDEDYGVLSVALLPDTIFDDEEASLLSEVASDIAFAIHTTRESIKFKSREERFHTLFQSMSLGVVYENADGTIVDANPAALKILGLTYDQLVGRTSLNPEWRCIHEDGSDFPGDEHPVMIALKTGKVVDDVIMGVFVPTEQTYHWIKVNAVPQFKPGETQPFQAYVTFDDITDVKQANAALAGSEHKYRNLFDNMLNGFALHEIVLDDTGKPIDFIFLEVNKAFQSLTGLKQDDIIGKRVSQVIPSIINDPADWIAKYGDVVLSRKEARFESYSAPLHRWYSILAYPQVDHQFACIFEDISERKGVEDELRHAKALLQTAMDQSTAGIAIADAPSGTLRYVNDAGLLIRGDTRQNIVDGVGINQYVQSWKLLDLDGAPLATDAVPLTRAIKFGETNSREFIIRRAENDDRVVLARAAPILEEGKVVAGIVVFLDITERKQMENSFRETGLQLANALQMAKAASWEYYVDAEYFIVNDNFYKMLRTTVDEVGSYMVSAKDYVERFCHPDDMHMVTHEMQRATENSDPNDKHQIEHRFLYGDGETGYMTVRISVEKDADGRTVKMYGVNQDITEVKRAEIERLDVEARLRQTQKLESIGLLAGGVAHDFNNLLMSITGYVDLCKDELESEHPVQAMLEEIRSDTRRSAKIVSQLLAFARKQPNRPEVMNLNDSVESMLNMLRRLIGENIKIVWTPSATPLWVKMDSSQLDQVVANLCVNAREAIQGTGIISITTRRAEKMEEDSANTVDMNHGNYVSLIITDDGCGMDRSTLDRVFDPFFTTRGDTTGTGLGLATVHGIVTQNNGWIDVESEVGKGTAFQIYLPLQNEKHTHDKKENRHREQSGGNETILFVDDEKSIRKTSEIFLKRSGYHVLVEGAPLSAIKTAEEHIGSIDLLITDVVMPDMTGKTLAKRIRQFYPDLKCIYISGYTDDIIANHGTLDEGVHFLAKPFDRQELTDKVRAVLDEIN